MSSDQIPSLPGKKRRQMPGVCPGGCWSFDLTDTLNVDIGRICGRERDSEKPAHGGRITKTVDCIRIVFGLPYNYKPNLSLRMINKPFEPSRSVSAMSVSWQFQVRDTNWESRCRTRHIQIRTMYRRTVNKTTWSNPRYNRKLFYFSVWVFETPNERVSIYCERACEREYFPEYLQCSENWQWI